MKTTCIDVYPFLIENWLSWYLVFYCKFDEMIDAIFSFTSCGCVRWKTNHETKSNTHNYIIMFKTKEIHTRKLFGIIVLRIHYVNNAYGNITKWLKNNQRKSLHRFSNMRIYMMEILLYTWTILIHFNGTVNREWRKKISSTIPYFFTIISLYLLKYLDWYITLREKVVKFSYFYIFGNKILLGMCTR